MNKLDRCAFLRHCMRALLKRKCLLLWKEGPFSKSTYPLCAHFVNFLPVFRMTRIHPIIDYTLRPSTGHNPAPTDDYIEPLFIRKRLTWVPSRDEMALRQSLAHELCTQLYPDHDGSHPWATEASVLLLMPLDRLKRLVDQCQPKDGVADKDNRAISSTHAVLVNMVGYVLFCTLSPFLRLELLLKPTNKRVVMQGKQLDAGYGTRFPLTDDDVRIRCCPEAAEEVPRNEVEAEKVGLLQTALC